LGADLNHRPQRLPSWSSLAGLIRSGRALRDAEYQELHDLVERSEERLKPLGEPLTRDIALNRWLARAREEAYSDWLFEQMNARELINVLSLREMFAEELIQIWDAVRTHVVRELIVEEGHEGQQGKIDLVLQLDD
jgi:hypothetical protein